MGEVTKLTKAAPKVASLRTTVPMSIVKQFNLHDGDSLEWQFESRNGELRISVRPINSS